MDNTFPITKYADYDFFTKEQDGSPIPQTSSLEIISTMLNLLQIEPEQKVLEIGTGSGFSAAVISSLVGPHGQVISIEVVPELATRARHLHDQYGIRNVNVVEGDGGTISFPETGFNRIVAWATPDGIPSSWIHLLSEGGVLVTPIKLLPLASTNVVMKFTKTDGELHLDAVIQGSFISMTSSPDRSVFSIPEEADLIVIQQNSPYFYMSSSWMKLGNEPLDILALQLKPITMDLLHAEEDIQDFRVYLLINSPSGLSTAFHHKDGLMIGFSDPSGFALLSLSSKNLVQSGSRKSIISLRHWVDQWRHSGRPGFGEIQGEVIETLGKREIQLNI